jgi:hypothetical protein
MPAELWAARSHTGGIGHSIARIGQLVSCYLRFVRLITYLSGSTLKKFLALPLAVIFAFAGTLALTTPPAQAIPGGCSVVLPSKLTVDAPYKRFTARLGSDCASSGKDYASWDVDHSYYGPDDILIFDTGQSTAVWEFYDWDHLGTYYLRPSFAYDADSNQLPQNTLTTSVRLGSRLTLTTARTGQFVTLRSAATRFTPSADRFRPWVGNPMALYRRANGATAWHYFRTVRTNKSGQISARFKQASALYYQARTADTSTTWGRVSLTKRR